MSPDGNGYDIVTDEMIKVIQQMWTDKVYPGDWTGNEPSGDVSYEPVIVIDGKITGVQLLLPGIDGIRYEGV